MHQKQKTESSHPNTHIHKRKTRHRTNQPINTFKQNLTHTHSFTITHSHNHKQTPSQSLKHNHNHKHPHNHKQTTTLTITNILTFITTLTITQTSSQSQTNILTITKKHPHNHKQTASQITLPSSPRLKVNALTKQVMLWRQRSFITPAARSRSLITS